jgi:hypothetical protein
MRNWVNDADTKELHPVGTAMLMDAMEAEMKALRTERAALRTLAGERCAPDENIIEWAIARIEWLEAKCDAAVIALANLEKTRADLPPANPDAARICLLRNMGLEA